MNQLKFSIITSTYNSQAYLRECIASVEKQNYQNYEHILIDANSTDKTLKIIRDYQRRQPSKVKLFQRAKKGISDAMNYGINKSEGELICHLHSDDMLYSGDTLNHVNSLFDQHPSAETVIGDCLFIKDQQKFGVFPKEYLKKRLFFLFPTIYLFSSNKISHPSVFLSKKVFLKHGGFSPKLKTAMDYEMWFRILPNIKVFFTQKILSIYRVHDQTTSNLNLYTVEREIKQIRLTYSKKYRIAYFLSQLSKKIELLG